ncbi:SusC/RagA family TonB-linked outer membrane protein [Pedobacter xixiisoli]|uniref:TonB-linked outer membrane protein, SusC/RagA family n=1 Tax=Pedobacter xixiisoli TaxID=1476464 RepID=A0A285ZZK2_9SPHI|nr:TonB-dependent receptor [Pedobacter xixiisoli]SOD15093.1 TonB-linked outer membrane protein, SusC/RagA family [Pedobacter xixiisoli]
MHRILQLFFLLLLIAEARAGYHPSLSANEKTSIMSYQAGEGFIQQLNQREVKGKVVDEKNLPMPGVSVKVKGSKVGTITNSNGEFSLTTKNEADSIQFNFIGYKSKTIVAVGKDFITVQLLPDDGKNLNEVAVVGYGTQKKISVTASLSTISVKELERVSTPSLTNAIAGKLPGIITRQASGEPGGDAAQLYIRGLSTFGSNGPLVLIDGVERDMNVINAQEIESFTILKDASATAIYGVRGANGVILINTRRGELGKPSVTYRSEAATLKALRLPEYINGGQYASLMNEALVNAKQSPRWSDQEIKKFYDGSDPYLYPNSNWTEAVLKENTWQTIQNLSVTGGTEIIKYYTNVGFTLQDGLYKQDDANKFNTNANIKRYNFRSNIDLNLSKSLTMNLSLGGIIQNGNYPGFGAGDIFQSLKVVSPIAFPVTNPDGSPGGAQTYIGWNPWGRSTQSGYLTQDRSTLQGTFGATWDLSSLITKGLSVRGLFSYDRVAQTNNGRAKQFEVKRYLGKDPISGQDLYSASFREEQPLAYSYSNAADRAIYNEMQVNYSRSFGKHDVSSMLLFNQRDYVSLTASSSILNIPYRRQGLAGRTTYGFGNRYFAEINFGYNGSENFPAGKRYGFFPSFSAGWVVSNERFWKVPVISNLKFRASHGRVGNDQINQRFLFLSTIKTQGQSYAFGPGQEVLYGMEENAIGNENVTWETAQKSNIGMDLGLFNNQLTLQVDVFSEKRQDILLQRNTVPAVAGFFPWSIPYANLGKVNNKGIDALLEVKHTTTGGLFYAFRSNFTFARNKVIENDEAAKRYPYLSGKGLRLGQSFAFVADGFFQSEEDIATSPLQTFSKVRVGDVKYKDINGDGMIDSFDQIPVGNPRLPEMSFGFGGTISYKGFDASVYFTGAANTSVFLTGFSMWPFYDGLGVNNVLTEYYNNRWTPSNTNARYPAIDVGNNPNNYVNSTLWMRNGNYLRLRNAEIGYTLPKNVANRIGISNLRVFVNGVNLVTWDHIKIIDPESNDGTGGYPLQKSLNAGLQINFK